MRTNGVKSWDMGPAPFVVNIDRYTMQNPYYRQALWTGKHMQLTLMSIKPGGDIGQEMHPNLDQFIRIESGQGLVKMGSQKDEIDVIRPIDRHYAVIVPAGTWHNIINTGKTPLKLYSLYAPPQHPFGTIHETKEIAQAAEKE